MMTRFALLPIVILALPVAVACTTTTESDGTGSSTSSSGASTSGGENGSCVPNNTDGASSCQGHDEPCPGGQYCSINICNSGCLSTANCPNGQFCDMAAASRDSILDKPIGICRACPTTTRPPGSSSGTSGSNESCSDVHGVYTMSADSGSSEECEMQSGECTVTQEDCTLTIACAQGFGTNTVTIDSNDKGSVVTTLNDGQGHSINANCTVSFTSESLLFDCQFTAAQGALNCKANGTKK